MNKIETLDGLVLSKICKEVSPLKYESIVKKNKLLDGSYHIQVIGEPIEFLEFTVIANEPQVEKINLMESLGEPIKLIDLDREFIGLIDSPIDWSRLTLGYRDRPRRLYEGSLKLILINIGDKE